MHTDEETIDRLPDEVLALAFSFIPCLDLHRAVGPTCRRWRTIVQDERTVESCLGEESTRHRPCTAAAYAGHARCLVDAMEQGYLWDQKTIEAAAAQGHLHIVRMLIEAGCRPGSSTMAAAVSARQSVVVRFLHEQERCPFDDRAVLGAIWADDVELLLYVLTGETIARRTDVLDTVMCAGRLDMAKTLRGLGFEWGENACRGAAIAGHLECLQYALADGCPLGRSTCACAAAGGHLKVLKWLRANGCPWDKETCAWAASGGYLKVLRWARANRCPWNKRTCTWAARGGHLKVLRWAVENGCPWNPEDCTKKATKKGYAKVARWIETRIRDAGMEAAHTQ
jgi:hypothetical protein